MLKRTALILLCLITILLVVSSFMDWNRYKPMVLQEIEKHTGIKVTIEGDLNLSLLPNPHLSVNQLQVKNIPNMPTSAASIDRLNLHVKLLPLFSKQVVIDSFSIKKGTFTDKKVGGQILSLAGIDIQGSAASLDGPIRANIQVKDMQYGPYALSNIKTDIFFEKGTLTCSNISCQAYGGQISGKVLVEKTILAATLNSQNIDLSSIPGLKDTPLKKGLLSATFKNMTAHIEQMDKILSTVTGDVRLDLQNGCLETIDVASLLESIRHIKSLQDIQKLQNHMRSKAPLPFKHLQVIGIVKNGQMNMKNLEFLSNLVTIKGEGNVGFITRLLDLTSTIHFEGQGNIPPIPLVIQGTLDSPTFSLDEKKIIQIFGSMLVKNMAAPIMEKAKKQVQEKITEKLKDVVGNVVGAPANDNNKSTDFKPEKIIQGLFR